MQAEMQERNNSTGEEYYDEGMYAEVEESYSNKHPLPDVPEHCAPPSKPLSFILQQAHDWTTQELTGILAPRNPIVAAGEVGKFAYCNRCIYVKLYAVVKWLKSWQKISHLEKISYYLDLMSEQFWDSHEGLHEISEDELPLIGLPHFDLMTALEVLTTHHFARTPQCIWRRHCKEKLSKNNKLATMQRLGDLLTNALIGDSAKLNAWINQVYIQNGILHLTAENEFFLRMILKDDDEGSRWQILTIKSLVNDYVAGIGHDLTHPQHDMEGLAVLVQEKMDENPKEALETMYNILHTFSLRLQLDILYTKTRQFIYHNPTFAQIKEYDMKNGILAFYIWPECSQTYLVRVTANRKNRFLKVQHYPHYHNLPDLDIENGNLKCDQFLLETGYHRAAIRIKQIKELLSGVWEPIRYFEKVGDNRIMLMYKIMPYQNTPKSEHIYITVNVLSGKIQCQIGRLLHQKDGHSLVEEFAALLERVLDEKIPFGGIRRLLGKIRLKILKEKYLEGLQGPHTHLLSKDYYMPSVWDITDLPDEKLLFNFHQDNNFYLLVTFEYDQFYDFKVDFYLIERSQYRKHIQELLFNKELWESTVPDLQFVGFKGLLRRPRNMMGKPNTTSWLTKCSQIRSFVAALDSRVQMAKIEEAIKQLRLQSEVEKEEAVGGDVISITDFSKPINFEDAGFQEHIQNVSLRMHRHGIFHMEICIKDHPVETKELKKSNVFRFVAAIHHATIPPNTSYHENLKNNLYDKLKTYAKLYKATRELAAVYELELKNKIDIVFYNYYKLIITYSKDRNLSLIVSWKINYDQLIANFGQVSRTKNGKVVIADRWNPHVLVSSLLTERLKESDSLPELVNYLVNTERSLSCIYYFSQVHLNSKRAIEQIIGVASGPNSINLKNILIPVTEYQIRLVHGSAHIDFYLLNNNKVGIKATQIKSEEEYLKEKGPKLQKLPGFSHFWGQFCMETKLETIVSREVQDYPRDPGNPSSVPPQETADAAMDSHPMSCPPKYDERFEEFVKYAEKQERDDLNKTFIIEPDVFEKAMSVPEDKEKPSLSKRNAKTEPMMPPPVSPFEGYLRAVNYIARLPQTLEAFARSQNPFHALPITDLKHDDWSVTFDLQGVHASTVAYPAWTVKFRVFLCPTKFTVTIKMEFSGPSQANDTDIKVFVKYFESVVVPMDNEYALHAFFCMCRINVSGVFSAFARLMAAQMDPNSQLNYYWIVHLQLVNFRQKNRPNENPQLEFFSGIVINKSDVLITIGLRPSKKREKDPFKVIKIAFIYNFDTENIRYQPTGANDENRAKVEAALHNMAMEPSEPCIIWPSVRRLIERFR